jgi:hypothetical protein
MGLTVCKFIVEIYEESGCSLAAPILEIYAGLRILATRVVMAAVVRPGLVPYDLDVLAILKRPAREFTGSPKNLLGGRMLL